MLLNLFSSRPEHPLAEPKELKRVLSELPFDNAYKAVDEIYGWYESLQVGTDFRVDVLYDVVRQLDEAAQAHLRRVARDYLHTPRITRSDERRLWTLSFNYWGELANLYTRCFERARQAPKERPSEALKPALPLIAARLVAARAHQLKWIELRYGPVGEDLWRGLGLAYLAADAAGFAQKPVQLYPGQATMTSVQQQYLQALMLHASSMDSLMPIEIELADRLIDHLQGAFSFTSACGPDSVYWVDAAAGTPPQRLARNPGRLVSSMRFFSPGGVAAQALDDLMRHVERGEVPKDLNLGGECSAKALLPVLRHLALYWAAEPPQREHPRHAVKARIAVLQGFDDCFTVFAGGVARVGKERTAETWVVENVSLGGFGAAVPGFGEWLRIGALLCLQPEGGENWVLGVVRRFNKDAEGRANVGIQSLSKTPLSIELWPRAAGVAAQAVFPGILLREGEGRGEMRLVLPAASFDLREKLEFDLDRRRVVLAPVELEESGIGFEIARYREGDGD